MCSHARVPYRSEGEQTRETWKKWIAHAVRGRHIPPAAQLVSSPDGCACTYIRHWRGLHCISAISTSKKQRTFLWDNYSTPIPLSDKSAVLFGQCLLKKNLSATSVAAAGCLCSGHESRRCISSDGPRDPRVASLRLGDSRATQPPPPSSPKP
jgi:hypothetical protein